MITRCASRTDLSVETVEERIELIVFLLRNRIVFMVVTLGTTHCQTEEYLPGGICPVYGIGHIELIRVGSPLLVECHTPVEPRCNPRLYVGIREQISRHILDDEPVIRLVRIESIDDIIPVKPHRSIGISVVTVRVSITGQVEPGLSHPFSVMGCGQHLVDGPIECRLRVVSGERSDLLNGRRQTSKIQ